MPPRAEPVVAHEGAVVRGAQLFVVGALPGRQRVAVRNARGRGTDTLVVQVGHHHELPALGLQTVPAEHRLLIGVRRRTTPDDHRLQATLMRVLVRPRHRQRYDVRADPGPSVVGVDHTFDRHPDLAVRGRTRQQPAETDDLSVPLHHQPVTVEVDHRVLELLENVLDREVLLGVVDGLGRGEQVRDGARVVAGCRPGREVAHARIVGPVRLARHFVFRHRVPGRLLGTTSSARSAY